MSNYPLTTVLRFDLSLPANAKINKAFVRFSDLSPYPPLTTHLVQHWCVDGSDYADPLPEQLCHFGGSPGVNSLTRTENQVSWSLDADLGTTLDSPNLSCVVQELVGLSRFYLIFTTCRDLDDDTAYLDCGGATLYVWYGSQFEETGAGGVIGDGTGLVTATASAVGSGGAVVTGSSSVQTDVNITGAGGVICSGEAELSWGFFGSGGLIGGGEAGLGQTVGIEGSGGVIVGQAGFATGYTFRLPIVVPAGSVSEDLTKFYLSFHARIPSEPVDPDWAAFDSSDNKLDLDIIKYSEGEVWGVIKVPTLHTESENLFYLEWR